MPHRMPRTTRHGLSKLLFGALGLRRYYHLVDATVRRYLSIRVRCMPFHAHCLYVAALPYSAR